MGIRKICFRCGIEQPLTEYYRHPRMADGHLNKCKTCTKSDSGKREEIVRSTTEGVEKERERHREKYHRLGYKEKQLEWDKNKPWTKSSTYKGLSKSVLKRYPQFAGLELHHWSYNHITSFFAIDKSLHKKIHRKIELDEKALCFKIDGVLIDTKQKHFEFLKSNALKLGIQEPIHAVEFGKQNKTIETHNPWKN